MFTNELVYVGELIEDDNEGLTNALGLELLESICACMTRILFDLVIRENLFRLGSLVKKIIRKNEKSFQDTKKKLKGDLEDMDYEMSYARVKDKDYWVFNDDKDEDPETLSHYHNDEFHYDSSSEE
ncbi:hypothetical protein FNV43_RR19007 [Rhamnella rubrinervis]|uniref:Uncharacterized protein n=1 Tax=Rhamnella rubrinervis TaxID=2594499 RepID=A0A8K0E1S1_9ROSA|nr:hypothetical protein FNV43_RR19007 [Rhamnella rubrinervis]